MIWLHDVSGGVIRGGNNNIELIDVIFAFSNIKLVRELVQDNIRQLNEADISKGQTEGLKAIIIQKQRSLYDSLTEVEKMLESIIDANVSPQNGPAGVRNIKLNPAQSQAFVGAIVFAINHMAKFVPGPGLGGSGLPESIA